MAAIFCHSWHHNAEYPASTVWQLEPGKYLLTADKQHVPGLKLTDATGHVGLEGGPGEFKVIQTGDFTLSAAGERCNVTLYRVEPD